MAADLFVTRIVFCAAGILVMTAPWAVPGEVATPWRDAWTACAIAAAAVLQKLFHRRVAGANVARKMSGVGWETLMRLGLVFGLALALFFLAEGWLSMGFWVWLIALYQAVLAASVWIDWSDLARGTPASPTQR